MSAFLNPAKFTPGNTPEIVQQAYEVNSQENLIDGTMVDKRIYTEFNGLLADVSKVTIL